MEIINVSFPNDGLGDKVRNAFIKVNSNFSELDSGKVDKIVGKGLSTNDYTNIDKALVSASIQPAVLSASLSNVVYGSGSVNYFTKWQGNRIVTSSQLYEQANGNITVGSTSDYGYKFAVLGEMKIIHPSSSMGNMTFSTSNEGWTSINSISNGGDGWPLALNSIGSGPVLVGTGVDNGSGSRLQVNGSIYGSSFKKDGGLSTQYLKADGSVSILTNPISGSGTANTLPKFTGTSSLGDSNIIDTGTAVTLNSGTTVGGNLGVGGAFSTATKINLVGSISGSTTSYSIFNQPTIQSDVTSTAYYNRTVAATQAAPFTLGILYHNFASQGTFGSGSSVTVQTGYHAANTLIGAGSNYGFRGAIPSGSNNWNTYMDGTAPNYFRGNIGIGTTTVPGRLNISTGISGSTYNMVGQDLGSVSFCNSANAPIISTKSDTTGLRIIAGSPDINALPDMRFDVRESDSTDFNTLTSTAFRFERFTNTLIDVLRNGNVGIGLTPTTTTTDKLQVSGNVIMSGVVKYGVYTVATLPSATISTYATVSDALTPSYMVAVVGGGSVVTPVFHNGTSWVCH